MKESLIKTLVKFGELSVGNSCGLFAYEPEIPFELQKSTSEERMEDIHKK